MQQTAGTDTATEQKREAKVATKQKVNGEAAANQKAEAKSVEKQRVETQAPIKQPRRWVQSPSAFAVHEGL